MSEHSDSAGQLSLQKQALLALEEMQGRLDTVERSRTEPIAIIGIGCRFPGGAEDDASYWQLLQDEVDAIREIPSSRWNVDAFYDSDPDAPGKMYTRQGGFLDDVDTFDAPFFGISPREAVSLDPQQRLLLEVGWQALENAGVAPHTLVGSKTGVYVGVMENDYSKIYLRDGGSNDLDAYYVTGNHFSFTAGRLSYVLGLHGPSMAMDTACSSSLVAIHLACQSLRSGESNLALAGGVNLILSPELTITMCKFKALSADGRCKTFDETADGFGQGEGCGIVVLKRLSDAITDGDNIVAVIRGSAVNHDGPSGGLTVPNGSAQQAVLRDALANAGVQPAQVSYVEAHGTGTSLGDPIEVRALGAVFGEGRSPDERLVVGSVKTNIGHLDSAAGVAGLIKVALALRHEEIPASLHLTTINPRIDLDELPVTIPTGSIPWPQGDSPRVAGVSAFGLSGTNAHIILEEAPAAPPGRQTVDRPLNLLTLSAKSQDALRELSGRYAEYLDPPISDSLGDICSTANVGRSHLEHRLAVVAESASDMREQLAAFASSGAQASVHSGESHDADRAKVAFLFTGQGAQYVGMGRRLYETEPSFRATLDRCDDILRPFLEESLLSVLFSDERSEPLLDDTGYTQPALFSLEYALAELWRSWGIEPGVVMGHSVGEYAAACVAGVFSLEDGLTLIAERARLMQSLPKNGSMAAVFATRERVEAAIADQSDSVSIAAINGPESIVVSGETTAVEAVLDRLRSQDVQVTPLNVSHAFHSPLMEPMLDAFEQAADRVKFKAPDIPLLSNLTGKLFGPDEVPDARYWRDHVRQAVQFSAGMEFLDEQGYAVFLEVGPSPTLLGLGRRCIPEASLDAAWVASLWQDRDDWQQMLDGLGDLYVRGCNVDWVGFDRAYADGRVRMALPTYPFQRQQYWLEKDRDGRQGATRMRRRSIEGATHPLLGDRIASPLRDIQFETHLDPDNPAFMVDHRVHGTVVVPGTAYVAMALDGAMAALGPGNYLLDDFTIREALILADDSDSEATVQSILTPDSEGGASFQVVSKGGDDEWRQHVTGTIRLAPADDAASTGDSSLSAIRARCQDKVEADAFYDGVFAAGLEYGPAFRGIRELWRHDDEAVGAIDLPASLLADRETYSVHPALLDAVLQVVLAATPETTEPTQPNTVYLPVAMDRISIHASLPDRLWGHCRLRPIDTATPGSLAADIRVFDEAGILVAAVEGLHLRRASQAALQRLAQPKLDDWLYEVVWEPKGLDEQGAFDSDNQSIGTWVVFDDESGLGADLCERLQQQGNMCTRVVSGEIRQSSGEEVRHVDPSRPDDFDQLFRDVRDPKQPLRGVVYLWNLGDEAGAESVHARGCGGALHLIQALERAEGTDRPDLWLVTRGAQPVGPDPSLPNVAQAPLWGLGAVITSEHADIHCVRVDLDPWPEEDETDSLFNEISSTQRENQVAFRSGDRYAARLTRGRFSDDGSASRLDMPDSRTFHLDVGSPGLLDSLVLRPAPRGEPGPGEVEVRVLATGLNFKDVLKALGKYPIADSPLGDECAGVISRVGDGVEGVQIGDRVAGVASGGFRSHVVTRAELVVTLPDSVSFTQAAALPIAYLTADYSLHQLAKMSHGNSVLIHSAAGGVGLMAVQLAQRTGAEIFATAGSPRKRALLRSLGVEHVMDSRTLDFADEVMRLTDGRGVDIILNSLAGDYIPKSLSVLAHDGSFVEIGRTDIWNADRVRALRPDVSYHPLYLGDVVDENPHRIREMLVELVKGLEGGTLEIPPHRVFPIEGAIDAFRFMAQSKHIGKVVLSQEDSGKPRSDDIVTSDATYLITGGLGGLGLEVAKWLAAQGAAHLVLVGRRGATGDAAEAVRELQDSGVDVTVAQADISDIDQVATLLDEVAETMPPLRGVIHAAAVLDDGTLVHQTWDRFEKVFAPKVNGAWNLHTLTEHMSLDFFVLFSSWAALVGLPGQGNYAAANAYLDALAHHRQAQGLPALSVNWGAWAVVGMAAAMDTRDKSRLEDMGISAFVPELGTAALGRLLDESPPQVAVLAIDWSKYLDYYAASLELPYFAHMAGEVDTRVSVEDSAGTTRQAIMEADPSERRQMTENSLREMAALVLRLPVTSIDVHQPLVDLGLDSLMSTEFFAHIERNLGEHLPLATLIKAPTVAALADLLSEEEQTVSWDSLVEIQPGSGNAKTPVFFVHAEAGNILLYRPLADHLGKDQPFYGLQAQGLSGKEIEERAIEDMAAHYIEEIRTVQPHGPYFLGGWCLGGAIAFEMAHQLRAVDEEVAELVMIQNSHRDYMLAAKAKLRQRLVYRVVDRVEYESFELSKLGFGQKLSYIARKVRKVVTVKRAIALRRSLGQVQWRTPQTNAYFLEALSEAHKDAYWHYKPEPYDGNVIIIQASKQPRGIPTDPTLGWRSLVDGEPVIATVESYHQTIMKEPQVEHVAEILKPYLDDLAEAEHS